SRSAVSGSVEIGRSPCHRRRRDEVNVLISTRCTYASVSSALRTFDQLVRQRIRAIWTTSSASVGVQPRSTAERTSRDQRAATYVLSSSSRVTSTRRVGRHLRFPTTELSEPQRPYGAREILTTRQAGVRSPDGAGS